MPCEQLSGRLVSGFVPMTGIARPTRKTVQERVVAFRNRSQLRCGQYVANALPRRKLAEVAVAEIQIVDAERAHQRLALVRVRIDLWCHVQQDEPELRVMALDFP